MLMKHIIKLHKIMQIVRYNRVLREHPTDNKLQRKEKKERRRGRSPTAVRSQFFEN